MLAFFLVLFVIPLSVFTCHSYMSLCVAVGIDPERFLTQLSHPACKAKQKEFLAKFQNKLVLVGRNRLDRINGVTKKFLAFEEFLKTYPQWKGKVVLVQVDEPPTSDEDGMWRTPTRVYLCTCAWVCACVCLCVQLVETDILKMLARTNRHRRRPEENHA